MEKRQADHERKMQQKAARLLNGDRRKDVTPTIATNSPLRPSGPSLPRSLGGMHEMNAADVCTINMFFNDCQLCILIYFFFQLYLTERLYCNCTLCKGQIKRMRQTIIDHVDKYGEWSINPLLSDAHVGYSNEV
jgi:hypothetical protein